MQKQIAPLALLATLLPAAGRSQPLVDADAVRKATSATVRIVTGTLGTTGDFRGQGSGSGVIISARGLILTNHHVVFQDGGQPYAQIWAGLVDSGQEFVRPTRAVRLKMISADPGRDLALLEVVPKPGQPVPSYPFLRLGSSADLFYGSRLRLVGFPVAGGGTTTVNEATVVGIDDQQGWIKVEGSMMRGVSGGSAINERGELVGMPTRVQADQEVPFFGDEEAPVGTIVLGSVGFIRSADAIRAFLSGVAAGGAGEFAPASVGLKVGGVVRDKSNGKPIPGAAIGFLFAGASPLPGAITPNVVVGLAKSGFDGEFSVDRLVKPGRYLVKIVHPQYRTLVKELAVDGAHADFEVTLAKE